MREHLREIAVGKPARLRARSKRPVDILDAVQLGEVDCLDRLAPDPRRARGSGLFDSKEFDVEQ